MSGMTNQQGGQQGLSGLLHAGERLASQMQNANPDLVDQLRQQFQVLVYSLLINEYF